MQLLIIQNGRRRYVGTKPLLKGKDGNLQTLAEMLPLVREDARQDLELRKRTLELIADCEPEDRDCEIERLFEFARAIHYVKDPIDAERIADAMTTINEGFGDCGDKAILLASMLGSVGYISRFVALNFKGEDDLAANGFDHLFIEVLNPDSSTWKAFDPTPRNAAPGWEAKAKVRMPFPIWPEAAEGISGGLLDSLIQQGVQMGVQYGQSQLQQHRASSAQQREIGAQFDNMDRQLAAALMQFNALPSLTLEQLNAAVQAVGELAAFAQQYGGAVPYVASQWASEGPRYATWLSALEGKTQSAAPGTGAGSGPTAGSGSGQQPQSLGSSLFNSPIVLVLIVLGIVLLKR